MRRSIVIALAIMLPILVQANVKSSLETVDQSIRHRNYAQAVKQLQPLLKRNSAEAQYRMAGLYRSGKGVKSNLDKATKLYKKAAISGLAKAQYILASILEKQGPAQRNPAEAMKWYQAAANQGYSKAIRKLAYLKQENSKNKSSKTSKNRIFDAIRINDIDQIRAMIKRGVNLDVVNSNNRSTLVAALLAGHREMSLMLLPKSSRLDKADNNGDRPIHIATRKGFKKIVSVLIKNKVNIDAQDDLGNTALFIATRHDDKDMISLLLKNKADYRIKNKKNQTAPQIAQTLKLQKAKSVFVKNGIKLPAQYKDYAKVDIRAFQKTISKSSSLYKGWPVLNIASLLGETVIVGQMLEQGASVLARDAEGYTALHRAASKGQRNIVKMLISSGGRVNAVNKDNQTPLYLAAGSGRLGTVKLLLSKGVDSSIAAKNKTSPLSVAIANGHEKSALALSVGHLDKASTHRALLLAIQNKMETLSIRLIKTDTRVNQVDKRKRSALWYSADLGLRKVTAELLRNRSTNINLADINGYTALARAVYRGHLNVAKLLIANKARINTLTNENNTLLMLSVLSRQHEATKILLSKNIDLNARNILGDTALMLAATIGIQASVDALIRAGADTQIRNLDDQNAYQIATSSGHLETANFIKENSNIVFKLFN